MAPPHPPDAGPVPATPSVAARVAAGIRGFAVGWPGPRHVLVVLVLLLVGIGVTVAALTRSQASEVALVPESVSPVSTPVQAPSPSPIETVQPLRVHVLGAVTNPGVVVLPDGAIVADALAAAGGLAPGSDPAELNLAARLTDGQQIIVGTAGDPRGRYAASRRAGGPRRTAGSTSTRRADRSWRNCQASVPCSRRRSSDGVRRTGGSTGLRPPERPGHRGQDVRHAGTAGDPVSR